MASIDFEGFVAGAGVKASALNGNFSKVQDAITEVETQTNSSISTIQGTLNQKASKNGNINEAFNVADPTEDNHAVNKKYFKEKVSEEITKNNVQINSLGNISGEIELEFNKAYTANIIGNSALSFISPGEGYFNCLIEFTINSDSSLTLPSSCKYNHGYVPTLDSGVTHRFTFDTLDNCTTVTTYYGRKN